MQARAVVTSIMSAAVVAAIERHATGCPGARRERRCEGSVLFALERLDRQIVGIERSIERRRRPGGPGVRRSAVEPWERDVLLVDGHARPRRKCRLPPGLPSDIEMISAAG